MYHVPLAFQSIYGHSDEGSEDGDGKEGSEIPREGENGNYLASCMQMTWCSMVSRRMI